MIKATLVTHKNLENNRIFNQKLNRDDMVDKYIKLRDLFNQHGFDLSTADINKVENSDIVIYACEMPKVLPKPKDKDKSHLIATESHFIEPNNFDKNKHKYFNKIFTWNDNFVDGNKYIKLNLARKFPRKINKNISKKKDLCTMIISNKYPPIPFDKELYSKRKECIRWFEKNYPKHFDLYGEGWNKFLFSQPKLLRVFNKIPMLPEIIAKIFNQTYPSYKGVVENKMQILERYKFSICFENAKDIPGYITEKIFHSFFAGCVPIYLGADNILSYIPKKCFIDLRDFNNYEDLFKYMENLSDQEYLQYLYNIEQYLNSKQSHQFKSEEFAKTIFHSILGTSYDNHDKK